MKKFKTQKDEFMSGIRLGDALIIERYAHIYEYCELLELLYEPNEKERIIKAVRVRLFENSEIVVVPVFFVEPLTINTLTLQKLGFDNFETETIYAVDGQFRLYPDGNSLCANGNKCIYVSTKSSPKMWIYQSDDDNFDRDDEHAIPIRFIYDIQHEYEKLCERPLDFSKTYVSNNAYDQKKKDYDKFIKDQVRDVLTKNHIYAGSDLASRLLKELSDEYAD